MESKKFPWSAVLIGISCSAGVLVIALFAFCAGWFNGATAGVSAERIRTTSTKTIRVNDLDLTVPDRPMTDGERRFAARIRAEEAYNLEDDLVVIKQSGRWDLFARQDGRLVSVDR